MQNKFISIVILNVAIFLIPAGSLVAQHDGHDSHAHEQAAHSGPVAAYILGTDPVTGKAFGDHDSLVAVEHEGREFLFANEQSAAQFKKDPGTYVARVDSEIVRQQLPLYALETCAVSKESLAESGDEVIDFVYGNRLVRICCKPCGPKFRAAPDKYLAEMDAATIAAQKASYPLDTCIVSGEALGGSMGDPIDHVIGNRLVRLCCKACKKKVDAKPFHYLNKLDMAAGGHSDDDDHGMHRDSDHEHDGGHDGGHDDGHDGGSQR